ncbi:MAG TPA: ABC transporter permease [Candidatus Dependentiae bacterium]|nr:ABC transporter permease [Candidatus Dependentiae bacterium]HRQ62439.1 ABC transporter permease [Candidatus Dependentiae bacterium]
MNRLSLFLAWRYLWGSAYDSSIATMMRICFFSILIGSFALALVSAVMHGYEKVIHEKMQGIHAQVTIRAYGDQLHVPALEAIIKNKFTQVKALSPASIQYVLVQQEDGDHIPVVVMLKAIDPVQEAQVSTIAHKITPQQNIQPTLASLIHDEHVVIGNGLAQELGIMIGDPIQLLYAEHNQPKQRKVTMQVHNAYVSGTFKTGIDEFDNGLVLCSFDLMQQLFPDDGVTQLSLRLHPGINEQKTIQQLQDALKLEVYSWKDLYPALVSALKLEKYAMFLILALITLVASMNIIALLFMQITQKRPDIAIIRAMGAPAETITYIFLIIGMSIALTASACGIALAWCATLVLQHYPFIELPDAYYVSHLPAQMDWPLVLSVFGVVLSISFVATWLTARRTHTINIAQVLRFEG